MLLGMNGFDPSFTPILQVISIRKLIRKIGVGVSGEGDERFTRRGNLKAVSSHGTVI